MVATKYCSHTRTGRTICANVIKEFYSLLQAGAALEAGWIKARKKLDNITLNKFKQVCKVFWLLVLLLLKIFCI